MPALLAKKGSPHAGCARSMRGPWNTGMFSGKMSTTKMDKSSWLPKVTLLCEAILDAACWALMPLARLAELTYPCVSHIPSDARMMRQPFSSAVPPSSSVSRYAPR